MLFRSFDRLIFTRDFEDFDGRHEFALFGKDYIEYNKYMLPGLFLYIRGTVQPSFKGDRLETKIKYISDLSELKESLLKSIQLTLQLHELQQDSMQQLTKMILSHKGKTPVKLTLLDSKLNLSAEALIGKALVNFDEDFRNELTRLGIEVKANLI